MAKDSKKRPVLDRRKKELDHAIKHGLTAEVIARRAEKVRAAAITVIKKERGSFAHVEGAPGNEEWKMLTARWEQLTTAEILELVRQRKCLPEITALDSKK